MEKAMNLSPRRIAIIAAVGVLIIAVVAFAIWKYSQAKSVNADNTAFAKYIEGYTTGVISREGTVRIRLASQVNSVQQTNQEESRKLFSISPSVKGKTYWTDARTVEFVPDEQFKPGQEYHVQFDLGQVTKVSNELNIFAFNFKVIEPSYSVEIDGLKAQNNNAMDRMKFSGSVFLADIEQPEQIEQLLAVTYSGKAMPIKWEHNGQTRVSTFSVDSLTRGKQPGKLTLQWDGAPIASKKKDQKEFEVPQTGSFKVLDIRAVHEPEQYVLVQFSDPILVAQHLDGLIGISEINDVRYTIDGSEVKVYAPDRLEGSYAIAINEGVENINSQKITSTYSANVNFENRLPSVSIPGKGTILPGSGKLTMPFEAVNLRAVDVTIVKIFENNIPQYFQNTYDSKDELRRVARPVVQKTIALDTDKSVNLRRKNRFSLDIDQLLKTEPGAIYRIVIGFRHSYSVYPCNGSDTREIEEAEANQGGYYYSDDIDEDDEFWARYNNYYPYDYDWDERDDPCHSSYYTTERWASRDMLASNIGLVAKRGNDNSITIVATSILTAQPMEGVEVKVLDYQQQVIQSATTNGEGFAEFEVPRKPFMLLAAKNEERGYLKLDDGSALPLGRFDVGGDVVQKGIKGFIYGERGVWRPGDSLFMGFIMEDQSANLPENHPVTFELYNPKGQLSKRLVESKHTNGFYTFKTYTETTAPTGNWLAKVSVGGAVFQKTLKVETVMPNRLRITLDFGGRKTLGKGSTAPIDLSARWLFGADVQNLKARVEATVSPVKTAFPDFKQYTFDDPTRSFATESQVLFDGTLDGQGKASFADDIAATNNAPGMLRANFTTRVFEPGGNFSIDNISMPYSPYNSYVGLSTPQGDRLSGLLLTDKDHEVTIVDVDAAGKKIAGNRRVQLEFYKIRWRWWWNQEGEYLGNFTQDKYNQLLKKETITLNNGTGKWNIRVNYPDWGRYLVRIVDLESGHSAGKTLYVDWPGWAQREQQNNPTEASMLSFTADKETYKVGEEVTLTIPSSAGGRGLISIENGSRVLKSWWIDTDQGQTTYKFNVEENMAPNVFVNVTLLQPHEQTANDLPIRMYGVIPLIVENPTTILKPQIGIAETLRPETKSSITVSESGGKAMTYTIAIVDEGLLDLTRFETPDPHASFYAREALGVKSWDLFDQVLGAWGGDLERILSIGGDGEIDRNVNPAKANRFQPVVKFLGPFTLRKGGKNTHDFTLPQYIGSVRAMVIAGQDGAYGFAEKAVAVKKPLMLLATLPRVIGPSETFKLPLTVFAMENHIKQVSLEVSASGGLAVQHGKQTLAFTQQGEQMAYATITAGNNTGVGKVKAIAKSGNETAVYEVEIDIRNPNPFITSVDKAEINGGATWQQEIKPLGPGNGNTAMVEISSLPPINLSKRLGYLIRYPYGCLEQVTSSVFPQLMLDKLVELTEQQKASMDRNIKAGINRLRSYQLPNGGLGYWPGARDANEWGTNYVGHFLLEAQAKGYTLPTGFLDGWIRYQRNMAQNWAPSRYNWRGGDLIQAYRLYLLALAKAPEMGAMNRLKEFQYLSDEAAWRLAAAYQLAGQGIVANQLVKTRSTEVKPYENAGYTFGSALRDRAMILETVDLMGRQKDAERLLLSVATGLGNDSWYSTQTTAYALLAIAKFGDNAQSKNNFSYTLNGKSNEVTVNTYLYRIPIDMSNPSNQLNIQNTGKNKLYIRLVREGQLPTGENPPMNNNPELLTMNVRYTNGKGEGINPVTLAQGTDLVAEVTLKNTGSMGMYEHIALAQIFPSGWEIINTRLSDNGAALRSSPATYQDIRDDRVLTYFNIKQQETLTYRVLLNASYIGRYFLPAVSAEAMYDNRIQAITSGQWVQVVEE
ncbi:alpha-2-macroglobulin family protein [Parapedobacter tibetensis]|uniref:alpha-2-macroglobulin family protein n=1 Tax=Parapedobacter tibetensis TaxID=2972951 RepID=UPI00214D9278|nr:MG2 domain-containing protein [Parapedobacter tibetensis]